MFNRSSAPPGGEPVAVAADAFVSAWAVGQWRLAAWRALTGPVLPPYLQPLVDDAAQSTGAAMPSGGVGILGPGIVWGGLGGVAALVWLMLILPFVIINPPTDGTGRLVSMVIGTVLLLGTILIMGLLLTTYGRLTREFWIVAPSLRQRTGDYTPARGRMRLATWTLVASLVIGFTGIFLATQILRTRSPGDPLPPFLLGIVLASAGVGLWRYAQQPSAATRQGGIPAGLASSPGDVGAEGTRFLAAASAYRRGEGEKALSELMLLPAGFPGRAPLLQRIQGQGGALRRSNERL
jgi:hypothetical protein